jgi:hypothetical protein
MMNRIALLAVTLALLNIHVRAQDSTDVDTFTPSQNIALYTMTGVIVPLAIAGTVISFFPPNGGVVVKDGTAYGSFGIETGYGDGDKREAGEFTDYRLTLSYAHIFSSKVRDLFRVEAKKDFHFDFVDRRKIFLKGIHLSAGMMSDFPNHGYSLGGGLWIKSPWLPFFGLFPSHTYGVTYRYNKYFSGEEFHEISLGMTSALTF